MNEIIMNHVRKKQSKQKIYLIVNFLRGIEMVIAIN